MSVTFALHQEATQYKRQDEVGLWTVDRFYEAAAAGGFVDPSRLELLHGRIVEKMPSGPLHTTVSFDVAENLRDVLATRYLIREERAIHIAFDSELIPDIALVRGRSSAYRERHPDPENVALLIEVAVTSVDYDLGEKALLYAQAGIGDYWVVLAEAQAVVVHRQPAPEGYQDVTRLAGSDTLAPLAAPEAVWTVRALLGRED